jgi:hypothetical protein
VTAGALPVVTGLSTVVLAVGLLIEPHEHGESTGVQGGKIEGLGHRLGDMASKLRDGAQ